MGEIEEGGSGGGVDGLAVGDFEVGVGGGVGVFGGAEGDAVGLVIGGGGDRAVDGVVAFAERRGGCCRFWR